MKKLITVMLCILSITAGNVYAELTYGVSQPSEAYLRYINLPPEERVNFIEPFTADVIEPRQSEDVCLGTALLPEKYDSRVSGVTVAVRNQMQTESCWAFSANTNLSLLLKKESGKELMFSPRHMENAVSQNPNDLENPWCFGNYGDVAAPRPVNVGGNTQISAAYYMRGSGPVAESDMPFENNIVPENTADIYQPLAGRVLDYKIFSSPYDYSILELSVKREDMKAEIYKYGSLNSAMLWNAAAYNKYNTSYYYSPYYNGINHAIVIVGWDDNYSKNNFTNKPSQDGAWIVQNSWGSSWGENGYFYISYDEASIYRSVSNISKAEIDVEYDNRYVKDQLGWSTSYYWYTDSDRTAVRSTLCGAVVFQKSAGVEELTEVTFGNNGATKYSIYVNPSEGTVALNKMIQVASGNLDFSGYKTVKLDTPVELTGTKFTVAVAYYNENGAHLPVEKKFNGIYSQVAYDGGTYVSLDGNTWYDFEYDCSIKAFTRNVTPKTKIPFVKSDEKLLVSMTDKNGLKLLPNADGTYSVPEGTYDYSISIYGKENAVKGKFKASGESKTLYAYLNPVDISTAKTALNDIIGSYGQNATTESLNDKLGKAVGSTFNFTANSDFTVTPPTDKLNGKLDGSVTLYDTFKNTSTVSDYDNIKLYKANIQRNASTVNVRGNSNTKAKLIIADYNASGALISAVQHGIDLTEGESQTVPYQNGVNTKIYLWDADRVYPYAESK